MDENSSLAYGHPRDIIAFQQGGICSFIYSLELRIGVVLRRLSTCKSSLAIWIHIWLQHFMDKLYFILKFHEFSWMDFHPIKGFIPIWGSKKRNKDFKILLGLFL